MSYPFRFYGADATATYTADYHSYEARVQREPTAEERSAIDSAMAGILAQVDEDIRSYDESYEGELLFDQTSD